MKKLLVLCSLLITASAFSCDSTSLTVEGVNETIREMIRIGEFKKDEIGKITIASLLDFNEDVDSFSYSIQRKDKSILELGHSVVDLKKCEFTTLPNGAVSHTGSSYFVFESE